jgi:PAS domain S-box-containing protein
MQSSHTMPQLLAALLDGMEAGLCAVDRDGVVTHWNHEATRILGWTEEDAVGRHGFVGWAARSADADQILARLLAVMKQPGRQILEFALLTKDGRRVLVRTQSAAVPDPQGSPVGVYCAFCEVHAQIDLERSIALSEALLDDASAGVVLIDADLRPAVVNACAARMLHSTRARALGRPLGDLIRQGREELEAGLQQVLAESTPPAPNDLWVTLPGYGNRYCWRCSFVRLGSPFGDEPVPLGVGWLFHDVTAAKIAEQEASRLRFRANQLHRAALAAAECEDPLEAATAYIDYALAGFAEHALVDLVAQSEPRPGRLERLAATSVTSGAPGPCLRVGGTPPAEYADGHPTYQAMDRIGSVRDCDGGTEDGWAAARHWPEGTEHGLCVVLRSRGRTLGVLTFLRGAGRPKFDRDDAAFAEDVAIRVAAAVELAR